MSNTIKRPLADVLWEAANVHLADDQGQTMEELFICFSIERVEGRFKGPARRWYENDFGVPYHYIQTIPRGVKGHQGIRYMLLLLAMHVAEDEGVMVEVAA